MMNLLKKAAISLAATSMIAAPVAASAAPAAPAARAASAVDGQSELEGSTSWIIAILALVAVVGGIIIASDNDDDSPTSPN
jgi:type IV secretory pathway VirB2 component (pilin)